MMTFDNLHYLLSTGKNIDEIRKRYYSTLTTEFWDSCNGPQMKRYSITQIFEEMGYNLKDYATDTIGDSTWYRVKLKNITIGIHIQNKNSAYLKIFEDFSEYWSLSVFDKLNFINAIRDADARYPEILRTWKAYEKEIIKFVKIRELSENAIESLVKDKLRGTGVEYNLNLEPTDVLLKVKMKRGRFLEIKLPHNGFSDILTDELIKDINSVAHTLNSIRYTCRIQRYGNNINWFKSE